MKPSGISVTPSTLRLNLATDPENFKLTYTNHTNSDVLLRFSARDFTGLEDGWRMKFLTPQEALNYRYGLSSWLKFQPESLVLKSGETRELEVSIRQSSLSGGGHYASIMADVTHPEAPASAVSINSQLVSLVFVRAATGNERPSGEVSSLDPSGVNLFSPPTAFTTRFNNTGNVELIPRGYLLVTDSLNREIYRGILNEESSLVLPESVKVFNLNTRPSSVGWPIPGRYTATLYYNYENGDSSSISTSFYNFGNPINLVITLILMTLFVIFIKHRLFKRK